MSVEGTTLILLSDAGNYEDVVLGEEGTIVLRIEDVYEENGECERGEQIGVAYIEETETRREDRVLVTVTFEFNDGTTLCLRGVVRRIEHNGGSSFKGHLGICGGTGKFKSRPGQADVDVCNPKRWIISSP